MGCSVGESTKTGYLPDVFGNPVLASCNNCEHCIDDSDGPEYGPPFFICGKKPHMSNLKGFPFSSAQKCCDLHIAYLVDWSKEDFS